MGRKEIVSNYLRTWFVMDMLASFPYSWIINYEEQNNSNTNPVNLNDP